MRQPIIQHKRCQSRRVIGYGARYLQVKLPEIDEFAYFCRYLDELVAAEGQDAQVHQVPNIGRQNLEIIITVKGGKKKLSSFNMLKLLLILNRPN